MGNFQAESKKQNSGSGFDLYGGLFNSKIFGSKPNMDRSPPPALRKNNAEDCNSPAANYKSPDIFNSNSNKDDSRVPLYWEEKSKDLSSANLKGGNYKNSGDQKYSGIGFEKSFGSMTLGDLGRPKESNSADMESKLADAQNMGRSSPIPGGMMLSRKASDGASSSSSSSGSLSGGSGGTKSGGPGGSSPIVGALKVGANYHHHHNNSGSNNHSGELSLGSVSSGGSSSGGSSTAESAIRGGRSLRSGNILNPKSSGSPTGDSRDRTNNVTGMITGGGGLGNVKKPGHSRGRSVDGLPSLKSSTPSRLSGELSSGPPANCKPPSGLQVPTGNIYNAAKGSSVSANANASNGGHLPSANVNSVAGGNVIRGHTPAPSGNILPPLSPSGNIGNIFPSGKVHTITNANVNANVLNCAKGNPKGDSGHGHVLGSGGGNYGHGSIMKGNSKPESVVTGNIQFAGEGMLLKRAMSSTDPEDVKNAANDQYKKGHFAEALALYDRAISLSPGSAPYRSNRAAALTGLGRFAEAVSECQDAIRLDPSYARAHHRLASLYLNLGQVDNARRQFNLSGQHSDRADIQRLQNVEMHLTKCVEARRTGDWNGVLRESDAAFVAGAESSPQVFASKAEALLKLHKLDEADAVLMCADKAEGISTPSRFHGIVVDSYVLLVRAQVDMALGRFESAVAAAEKSAALDCCNREVSSLLRRARAVANARSIGNELFKVGKYLEACTAYGEGLEHDPMNAVLLCNRAACRSKLDQWDKSVEDCNLALSVQPNYTKALLRRAASNTKLERWEEALRDYEILRKELPWDKEVLQSYNNVQVELKKSRGEEIYNMKFGGAVEVVSSDDQFRDAINSPGLAVVHFNTRSNDQCKKISPFFDQLCGRYRSANFLKVDIEKNQSLARSESISIVPTFKIYKNGVKVKEIICPSQQGLENLVKHYYSL